MHSSQLTARLLICLLLSLPSWARAAGETSFERFDARGRPLQLLPSDILTSSGTSLDGLAKAAPESLYIYGGPGSLEGKFENASGQPDWGGWTSVDDTDLPVLWQISSFEASNLNGNGAGNLAAWCGQSMAQQPGWVSPPGYGNNWDQALIFEVEVSDPSQPQTVSLDFYFNHDTEPGYDFFSVEYDSADGNWETVYEVSGTSADGSGVFAAPGVQFSQLGGVLPIDYPANGYGAGDKIRIRLRFTSDGAWSDEDGHIDTKGAVQVDDITVVCSEGTFVEGFEAGYTHWRGEKLPFAGDFASLFSQFQDIDPCVGNASVVAGFVDFGQDVTNSASSAEIPGYPTSTGGETSAQYGYGFPGGWVVNHSGGLSGGETSLRNRIVSPPIPFELPGPEDDALEYPGVVLRYDVWAHIPLLSGMYFTWDVRYSHNDGLTWSPWSAYSWIQYWPTGRWLSSVLDVSSLIGFEPTHVQISFGVVDLSDLFGLPGLDSTPSPIVDNVALVKYAPGGPLFRARTIDLAQDGFPVSGSIDASTPAARAALSVPFSMAGPPPASEVHAAGDSIVVDVFSRNPFAPVSDVRMVWKLFRNPLFEDAIRQAPSRTKDENVVAPSFPTMEWSGEVVGEPSRTTAGVVIENRWFFDLPDEQFLYPGDLLNYYIQATDTAAETSTLPYDLSGFDLSAGYDRTFVVRALPSLVDATGSQPPKLVVNDFGRRGGEPRWLWTLNQLGFLEGSDYDTYTVQGPTSGVGNGIGSAGVHGANANQLAGYETIVYESGNLSSVLLSDGNDNGISDFSDDLGVLSAWHDLPGDRNMVYFGDNLAHYLETSGAAGADYVANVMGVDAVGGAVKDWIDGQTAPVVRPVDPSFAQPFVAYGGCPARNDFDAIVPIAPAFAGHGFEVTGSAGMVYPDVAASVIHDRFVGADRKVDMTFPFGLYYVYAVSDAGGNASGTSVATELLREVFDFFAVPSSGTGTGVPDLDPTLASLSVHPSPFNPRTVVSLMVPSGGDVVVQVFDLRGRRVATLYRGEVPAGPWTHSWSGVDDAGAALASGVYVVRATGPGFALTEKAVLLK